MPMPPDYVLCFDRDYTVDVNPHPDPDQPAVPLWWVKQFAHGDAHAHIDVWATGNQHLTREANIPGIEDAIAYWQQLHDASLSDAIDVYTSEYRDTPRPTRRGGLHLIHDIYTALDAAETTRFIVVDDVDLTDLEPEGWTHYFPWAFYSAVGRGDAPVTVPETASYSNLPANNDDCPDTLDQAPHYPATKLEK